MLETESDEGVGLNWTPRKAEGDRMPEIGTEEVGKTEGNAGKRKRETVISLESENIRISSSIFHRVKTAETACALLALFSFGCFAISTDLQYTSSLFNAKKLPCRVALLLGTLATVLLTVAVVWRNWLEFRWERARCLFSVHDNFLVTGKWTQILVEMGIIWPHPMLWLQGIDTDHEVQVNTSALHFSPMLITYSINSILSVWSLLRVYYLLRLLFIHTLYSSSRAQRVCRMNGGSAGQTFILRCLVKKNPYALVLCFLAFGVFSGAYAIRIFERPMSPHTAMDFSSYANCIWYCLITILTIGYGDYYAVTTPGRVIALGVCIWGVVLISVMVCFVAEILAFDAGERNALDILERLDFRRKIEYTASAVLVTGLKYCLIAHKRPSELPSYAYLLGRFRRYVNEFESMRVMQRKIYKLDTWEDNVQRRVRTLTAENTRLRTELSAVHSLISALRSKLKARKAESP